MCDSEFDSLFEVLSRAVTLRVFSESSLTHLPAGLLSLRLFEGLCWESERLCLPAVLHSLRSFDGLFWELKRNDDSHHTDGSGLSQNVNWSTSSSELSSCSDRSSASLLDNEALVSSDQAGWSPLWFIHHSDLGWVFRSLFRVRDLFRHCYKLFESCDKLFRSCGACLSMVCCDPSVLPDWAGSCWVPFLLNVCRFRSQPWCCCL